MKWLRLLGLKEGHSKMKRFELHRHVDATGISGTGVIAEGVMFSTGEVCFTWLTDTRSIVIYSTIEDVEKVHGHNGGTEIVWID